MTSKEEAKPATLRSHHFSSILKTVDGRESMGSDELLEILKKAVVEAELTSVADVSVKFQPQGVSAVVVLEESHVAVHLWPEHKAATVDIHVCDYSQDNERKAVELARLLGLQLADDGSLDNWSRLTVALPPAGIPVAH